MKYVSILLIIALLCFSGCFFPEETALFYKSSEIVNGFWIAINQTAGCCFVSDYEYNGEDNRNLIIPDECSGYPITRLGGYYGRGLPCPFGISLSDEFRSLSEHSEYYQMCHSKNSLLDSSFTEADIIELNFNLHIGKNIETIVYVDMDSYYVCANEDGELSVYHPTVYITCSAENKHFYSENGKLYTKDGVLVEEFAYSKSLTN